MNYMRWQRLISLKSPTSHEKSAELTPATRPTLVRIAQSAQEKEEPVLVRVPVTALRPTGLLVRSAKSRTTAVVLVAALAISGVASLRRKSLPISTSARPILIQPLSTATQELEQSTVASTTVLVPITRAQNRNNVPTSKAVQSVKRQPAATSPPISNGSAVKMPPAKAAEPEPPEVSAFVPEPLNIAALNDWQAHELAFNLANIEKAREAKWPSQDADAVLATLKKYSEAWSLKDVSTITALRPGLGERRIKKELSNVRSITMQIRPLSSPKVEGDHAAVDCIHEVHEVFSDGVVQSQGGMRMNYAFVRRGRTWLIEESTQQAQR